MPAARTVLDLGANIGLTAAHYQAMWPFAQVLAVEMDLDNCELARRNFTGIVFQRAVVGRHVQQVRYSTEVAAEAYSVVEEGDAAARAIFLLDLIVSFFGSIAVDFCKMDVEGSEWGLLEMGTWWSREIRHLLIELHGEPGEPSEDVRVRGFEALTKIGYDARHHPPHPQAVWAVQR
jgi:FkbM family methyltransferase